MELALALAQEAALDDEVPVGAVVLYQGKVIGKGRNHREKKNSPISHAEIEAIQAATEALGDWRLTGCTLYVTLEPCPMCLAACQQARIERVVYGAVDPKGGAISLNYKLHEDVRLNHRFSVEHAPHEECGQILKDFFSKKRAKKS
jgi:tRNA(adenine34) deaminase